MPNLYKSNLMKKYVKKEKDVLFDRTGINKNSRILITGMSGSGKTNALMEFIIKSEGFFNHIFLCYKTEEKFYKLLQDQLIDYQNPENSSLSVYKDLNEFPHIEQFIDSEEMDKKKIEHYLLILDDCVLDTKANKNLFFKLEKYFKYGRKRNLTIVFLTQSYFDVDLFLRKQMTYLIFTKLNNESDLKRIIREFSSFLTADEIYKIYKQMLLNGKDELPCMMLNLVAKNINEYIAIDYHYLKFKEEN